LKPVLKIAAGAFLGIIAAIVVISVFRWLSEAHGREAQRKQDAQEVRRLKALQTVESITPEKVIVKCGEPIMNMGINLSDQGGVYRRLGYQRTEGKDSLAMVIEFAKEPQGNWRVDGMGYGMNARPNDVASFGHDPVKLLETLPCLEGK
jgi:hypothetical protein